MCKIYRKHTALFAIFMALTFSVFAQTMSTSMMADSNKVFNGTKAFKKWSVGINVGVMVPTVLTGGSNDYTHSIPTFGYGGNVKYQFTHYFAMQGELLLGNLKGDQRDRLNDGITVPTFPNYRPVYSFKTDLHWAASLSGMFTFGNINWLWHKNLLVPYVTAGAGIADYRVFYAKTITQNPQIPYLGKDQNHIRSLFIPVGFGFKIKASQSLNIDLGYRMNYVDADNFDGFSYTQTAPNIGRQLHKDKFSYGFVGVELALGKKSQPQLMFDNPVNRMNSDLQNQINVLRSQLNLADTDGDGVADIFDKEPNTPAGCPVDSHGVTKDTDGDGVPDCRDKELITPTYCQPVDANGVGKCPPPECCNNRVPETPPTVATCAVGDLPSLSFKGNSTSLSADTKAILATVAGKLKANPLCSVEITGYPAASKASQAVCNKRTMAIKMYLSETEGVSGDRLTTNCSMTGGDGNTIDLKVK